MFPRRSGREEFRFTRENERFGSFGFSLPYGAACVRGGKGCGKGKLRAFFTLPLQFIQNHSLPNAGTEYTPQWTNTPNFAWSYHVGNGLESKLVQSGSYRRRTCAADETAVHASATSARATNAAAAVPRNEADMIISCRGDRLAYDVLRC